MTLTLNNMNVGIRKTFHAALNASLFADACDLQLNLQPETNRSLYALP